MTNSKILFSLQKFYFILSKALRFSWEKQCIKLIPSTKQGLDYSRLLPTFTLLLQCVSYLSLLLFYSIGEGTDYKSCRVLAKIKVQSYFTQLNQISHPVRWPRLLINTSWQQQLIYLELTMKRIFLIHPALNTVSLFFFPLASNIPYSGKMLPFALADFKNQHYSYHGGSLHFIYTHTHNFFQFARLKSLSFFILETPKGKLLFLIAKEYSHSLFFFLSCCISSQ